MAGFFQVPEAFAALERHVIPALFEGKGATDVIRIWVAGCATGEEAYSVAILFFEYANRLNAGPDVKVYASDNDQDDLRVARRGVYPFEIAAQMSQQALDRYFKKQPDGYHIIPSVRNAVSFSAHDVLIDKAFQSLDLITCRHLLAVLDSESRGQIISFFHHALRQRGFLFLGDAAFASRLPAAFEATDDAHQIYQLKQGSREMRPQFFEEILDDDTLFPPQLTLKPDAAVDDQRALLSDDAEGLVSTPATPDSPDGEPVDPPASDERLAADVEAEAEAEAASEASVAPQHAADAKDDAPIDVATEEDLEEPPVEAGAMLAAIPVTPLEPLVDDESDVGLEPEDLPDRSSVTGTIDDATYMPQASDEVEGGAPRAATRTPGSEGGSLERSAYVRTDEFASLGESDGMAGFDEPVQSVSNRASERPDTPDRVPADSERRTEAPPDIALAPNEIGGFGIAPKALVVFHQEQLLRHYIPPSALVDEQLNLLHVSGNMEQMFKVRHHQLERDYLEQLPAVYGRRVAKAIQQAFFQKDPEKIETIVIPSKELGNVALRVQYLAYSGSKLDVVQLVFEVQQSAKNGSSLGMLFAREEDAAAGSSAVIVEGMEEMLGRLILIGPFPMLLHAEGGTILEMNRAWADLTSYAVGETTTLTAWTKLVRGQRIQLKDPKLAEKYARKGIECISVRTKSGDTKLLALHSAVLSRDRKGRRLTLTMALDISGHSGQYGVNLVSNGADDTSRAKSAFLANISHEVRTPLTSMIGFAEHLSGKLNGQDAQFARYISDSGYRLLETLNAILRMAALEGQDGDLELNLELIDITLECQGLLQLFKPYADQYDLPLKMVIKQPVKAYLDRAGFRRIVGNIIGNAIKFTRRGEITITVSAEGDAVCVAVDDTGIGISEDFLPFIFDRFTQETKGEGRSYAGCGLGLAIAKTLADKMNGTIAVDSTLGSGSKFTVRLPIGNANSSKAVFGGENETDKEKQRILVIEDDIDTQELMLLILQDRFVVDVTSNATEALQKAQQETYDIVLMDLNLGGNRSGFELLSELRRLSSYVTTPVLAVSALPIDVIRKQLIKSGFNGFIAKPFTRARIFDAMDNVLGQAG